MKKMTESSLEFFSKRVLYKNMLKSGNESSQRIVVSPSEVHEVYPFPMLMKIKDMLKYFKTDDDAFELLIKQAVYTWEDEELGHLAECLVNYLFYQPEAPFCHSELCQKLSTIIEIDLEFLKEKESTYLFMSDSLTMKIFAQIIELPECRSYIDYIIRDVYESIDLSFLESIEFKEDVCIKLLNRCNSDEIFNAY